MTSFYKSRRVKFISILAYMLFLTTRITAQDLQTIKGTVVDGERQEGISYATVALYTLEDSTLVTGALSHDDGSFELQYKRVDMQYLLMVNFVGYHAWAQVITHSDSINEYNLVVALQPATIELDEAVVVSERMRAEKSFDKATFFVNKRMLDASNTGIDILRHIPSIQIDFMQNIRLEGSPNILILVDGKERDKSFLLQLNAKQVDRIEVINTPGANYDGNATGIINVVLKKDKSIGFSGNAVLDIPMRKKEMYLFPLVNLNFGLKKMNFYGSYKGEISFFDLIENSTLSHSQSNKPQREINTLQYLRQENWEHNFTYGWDYFINDNNVFNFYANYRTYSNETNGQTFQFDNDDLIWSADKEEDDINHSGYYSVFYKRLFEKQGQEIAMDVNYYHYKRNNHSTFQSRQPNDQVDDIVNSLSPKQRSYGLKIDYANPITEKLKAGVGVKLGLSNMEEHAAQNFNYYDHLAAAYGTITYSHSKLTGNAGLRVEQSFSGIDGSFDYKRLDWLPNTVFNYQLNQTRALKFSYSRRITRPYIYQLNPATYSDDPYIIRRGNEHLTPALQDNLAFDYSALLGNNYLATQIFYKTEKNAIRYLYFLNDEAILESRFNNIGRINSYGIQLTTALKLGSKVDFNGYFKTFGEHAIPNDLAAEYQVEKQENIGVEFGVSSAVGFKYGITASVAMQYSSPRIGMQDKTYQDFIYFISVDKTVKNNFKFGMSLAPLFVKKYTYRGLETTGIDFKLSSEGDVQLPSIPIIFKVNYQFVTGKNNRRIEREKEIIDNKVKTGL